MKRPRLKTGRAAASRRRTATLRLWHYALALCLVLAAILAGAMAVGLQQTSTAAQAQARELLQAQAAVVARAVGQAVSERQERLRLIAARPQVAQALSVGDADPELPAGLRASFPGASRVLLVGAGLSEPDLEAQPPIGYALLDMLQRAATSGAAPPPEIHLPGQPQAHLNLVQPVVGAEGVLGHLIVTYPGAALQQLLAELSAAPVALERRAGGQRLASSAALASDAGAVAAVAGTPWQLRYQPEAGGLSYGSSATSLGSIYLPAVLAVIAAVGLAFYLLGRALRRDVGRFAEILEDLRGGRLKLEYPVALALFRPAVASAVRQARELEERPAPQPAAAKPQAPGAPAPEPPAAALSGLEVVEQPPAQDTDPQQEQDTKDMGQANREQTVEPEAMQIDPAIFRAYDIRGIVGKALNAEVMRLLGQSIGSEAAARGQQQIVVGRDGRLSSDELAAALIEGLTATGRNVIDIGQVPTPVTYFACHQLGTQAGVMVTGSHNPKDYNGLKIMLGGETLSGEQIQALGRRAAARDFVSGEGQVSRQDVVPDYIDRVASDATLHRPLKVVLDCGNGVAGAIGPQLLRSLGCEVEELYCEVDGHFPNHHPDPTVPENLEALISLVRLQGADLGIAYDGDADRIGVVDGKGKIIWADRQMMLYARDVLTRNPGADIVFDVKCTAGLAQLIREHGGRPVMWQTGHSLIKHKLKETGAPLAGEMSGHIFFKERWYGFDDAMYSSARLLEILSQDQRAPAEVFAELPEALGTPELRVDLEEGEPPRVMENLAALADELKDAKVTTIDGIRADFADGWGLVRASNTTPSLVLRFEADDPAALERIQGIFRERIKQAKPDLELPF